MPPPGNGPSEPVRKSFPLSAGQERLWWLRQLDSSRDQYHITAAWCLPHRPDANALDAAFASLMRRHEILRTAFVLRSDGRLAQDVLDQVAVPVRWAGTAWRPAVEDAAATPFDLADPPLLRAVVADLGDEHGIFVALHHIVTDRWSMDVFGRDLFAFYEAALTGTPARLPVLEIQYGDHADLQRRTHTSEHIAPHLEYWTTALAGVECLDLPSDRPRPAEPDPTGASVVVELPEAATAALAALAWRARASPVMVLTAALITALSTFTGRTDIVIGAVASDRPGPEVQDLIGFFINTMVLRVDVSGPITFRETIKRTRDVWLAADAHKDAPFEQIVAAVKAGSDDGRNPIFDITVNHAGGRTGLADAPDAPRWWYPDLPVTARFDLSVTTQIVDGRLRAAFLYRTALFDEAPIAALAIRYLRLLEVAVAEPDRPMHEFDLLDDVDRKLLLARNDPEPAPSSTVVELVHERGDRDPTAVAVAGSGGVLTYRVLDESADLLARSLREHGVGRGHVVGVCLDVAVDRPVVLLAVLKAGAAYLPLDAAFPTERLAFLLADASAVLVVASPGLRDRLPRGTPVLVHDHDVPPAGPVDRPTADPLPVVGPDDLAYLISTSGSTGTPKSVAVPHRALTRLATGAARYLDVGPGTAFLQCGPLTFDVAVLEWAPLVHGGRVVVADPGPLLDDLHDVVRTYGVTTLKLVSPQLELLLAHGVDALTGLRQVVVGGDVVNPAAFAAVAAGLPDCRLTASYGPTECAVLATTFDDDGRRAGRVPIGHAVPHTRVYVLDNELHLSPVGARGQVHVAGDGVARGYHGRPGLTAERFVPDPYGPPGSRMYRTGDVGRYLLGGAIDFLGRADHQVKIRGFRVETGEVEHALLGHSGVRAAVVVRSELDTGPALVAYVVAEADLDRESLRRHIRETLPGYLVPDHIVELPRLPLTANNKVDRAALPPVTAMPAEASDDVAVSGLEVGVTEAWSAVLGTPLAPGADFFDNGGHSLLVPRATAAVRRLLGREVPLRLMLDHRTPLAYTAALLRETLTVAVSESRDGRLTRTSWSMQAFPDERRLDWFHSAPSPHGGPLQVLVVLDGADFVDVMRMPAVLDRLAADGATPTTAAVFISPPQWSGRGTELTDDAFADMLADELVPLLAARLGDRWSGDRAVVVGASLGAVAAIRAALRRPDRFAGAVALSGPLSEHRLGVAVPSHSARIFLSAGHEEADIVLEDGTSLLEANATAARELAAQGHVVRWHQAVGGHTYASWESQLSEALPWVLAGPE